MQTQVVHRCKWYRAPDLLPVNQNALLTNNLPSSTTAAAAAAAVITDKGKENGLPVTVSTKLPKQPGGSGGKVLAINVLQVGGRPVLVLLSSTSARFNSR